MSGRVRTACGPARGARRLGSLPSWPGVLLRRQRARGARCAPSVRPAGAADTPPARRAARGARRARRPGRRLAAVGAPPAARSLPPCATGRRRIRQLCSSDVAARGAAAVQAGGRRRRRGAHIGADASVAVDCSIAVGGAKACAGGGIRVSAVGADESGARGNSARGARGRWRRGRQPAGWPSEVERARAAHHRGGGKGKRHGRRCYLQSGNL